MGELREDSAPYVGYDYKEIPQTPTRPPSIWMATRALLGIGGAPPAPSP